MQFEPGSEALLKTNLKNVNPIEGKESVGRDPLVSVLMNCFNGERYLREALDSVRAQTYQNWEIVFWDNCSTDRSAEIFKSYDEPRFTYLRSPAHTNLGLGRATAWEHLKGDLIAFLDTDDVWLPHKLENQVPLFADRDVGIVFSDTLFFTEKKEKPLYAGKYPPVGFVFERMLADYFISLETAVVRRTSTLRLKRTFDPEFNFIMDFDLLVRLSRISKVALCPKILAKWRVHANSTSWKHPSKFVEEKNRWLRKQIAEEPGFARQYAGAVRRFKSKNQRAEAVYALCQNRRIAALKLLLESGLNHWQAWALLPMCLLPYSGSIVAYLLRRRSALA